MRVPGTCDRVELQVTARGEGAPYRTLIASVLHKYVAGRLAERRVPRVKQASGAAQQRPRSST